jgi:hypothetical protein
MSRLRHEVTKSGKYSSPSFEFWKRIRPTIANAKMVRVTTITQSRNDGSTLISETYAPRTRRLIVTWVRP